MRILTVLCVGLSSCTSAGIRIVTPDTIGKVHPDWTAGDCAKVSEGKLFKGQTKDQVECALGGRKQTSFVEDGTHFHQKPSWLSNNDGIEVVRYLILRNMGQASFLAVDVLYKNGRLELYEFAW